MIGNKMSPRVFFWCKFLTLANVIVTRTIGTDVYLGGALYPQASETRDLSTLDGIWNFRKSPVDPEYGYKNKWYEQDLKKTGAVIPMPVPSSYNDVGVDVSLREHVGLVWYDRRFHVPPWWLHERQRVWLRFSSVHYSAQVWVNGKSVMFHEIGHLPFEVEITDVLHYNTSNLLTVAVNNTLLKDTVPQGTVKDIFVDKKIIRKLQSYTFDFFNYAGIHRTVFLYSTPQLYIDDVIVKTEIQDHTGVVHFNVTSKGQSKDKVRCLIQLYDKSEKEVAASQNCTGSLKVPNSKLWWPYLMHSDPGYLYTFKTSLISSNGDMIDTYTHKIGIRTVAWSNNTIYINNKPIYLRGFAMHEDSDIRGRGWDPVLWVRNFELIRWLGANAFRTSHYPYAEEIYQLADEQGIMIIDECPSSDTKGFTDNLLKKHKHSLTELIRRDKNHPSVVMWSLANEPRSEDKKSDTYFAEVVRHVKSMDLSRPVTSALFRSLNDDKVGQHLDVICVNRYIGWYPWYPENWDNSPRVYLIDIAAAVFDELKSWKQKYQKPVMISEYGAGTLEGLHRLPAYAWSEEYQVALMSEHFKSFDKLRQAGLFNGEFIWNFADTMTAQRTDRPGENKKGIFTRERQPKASAHHLRARYLALAAADTGAAPPEPAYYVAELPQHEEL